MGLCVTPIMLAAYATIAAGVGAGTAIYGTIKSTQMANKQAKTEARIAAVKNARERRQAVREAAIARANILQAGANQGASSSSAVEGGAASITSQLDANLSFLDQIGSLQQSSAKYGQKASTYSSIAKAGGTIFEAAGGFGAG